MKVNKLLHIVSSDFGELGLAIMFARNHAFSSAFAMPNKLLRYFDEKDMPAYGYDKFNQIMDMVDKYKPNLVIFYSSYLFTLSNLASRHEFSELKIELSHRKIKIATSDPFVRVFDYYPELSFDNEDISAHEEEEDLRRISQNNRNMVHIYNHPIKAAQVKSYGFYNPHFAVDNRQRESDKKNWTFVISNVDIRLLLQKYGEQFGEIVVKKLYEVCSNEQNRVTLIASSYFVEIMKRELGEHDKDITLKNYCTTSEFESLIAESDVVFYWNVFSNSILLCWYYNVPALFFDRGHIGNLNEAVYNHVLDYAYAGNNPEYVPLEEKLNPNLDALLDMYYSSENRKRILASQMSLSSPEKIVGELCK